MLCRRCGSNQSYIEQAPDSHARRVFCPVCLWWCWLNSYNPKVKSDFLNSIKLEKISYKKQESL